VPFLPADTHAQQAPAKSTITTIATITTEKCHDSNERGLIEYVRYHDGKVYYMPCDHNPATIIGEALKREADVGTIKNGCEQPVDFTKLKIRLGLIVPKEEKKEGD
jgi:uncharacterized protein YqjF (DUF2071 family)